ncbi:hypothetical protein NKR19_g7839 [Coniochaeta hoffmannii]|uniref:Uncharacterized protein n=1 Tax=Coniochaeta hoffmannii TaxID=91930 RepID=A0AA38RTA4_9PEZI|nr:hypothetical protein NKR19_g7839 [Coniochaeta hoffmannii]
MKPLSQTPLLLLTLLPATQAWRVGLWPYKGEGKDQQYSGTVGAGVCHTVDAIKLGQVTFDATTKFWADMHEVIVYGDKSCDPDFKIYSGKHSLTGKDVKPAKVAKSFLVQ